MNEKIKVYETKMGKTIANLESEDSAPSVQDVPIRMYWTRLTVDYYGTPSPLQQVGNVSVPEPRIIQIQPWESKLIREIEKVIMTSDLGINPTNDGKSIRLVFPELTEERQ